jgi:hypothetical protein
MLEGNDLAGFLEMFKTSYEYEKTGDVHAVKRFYEHLSNLHNNIIRDLW